MHTLWQISRIIFCYHILFFAIFILYYECNYLNQANHRRQILLPMVSVFWDIIFVILQLSRKNLLYGLPLASTIPSLAHLLIMYCGVIPRYNRLVIDCFVFLFIVMKPISRPDRLNIYLCNDLSPISEHKCWSCPVIAISYYTRQVYYEAVHGYHKWYNAKQSCYTIVVFPKYSREAEQNSSMCKMYWVCFIIPKFYVN